MITSYEPFSRTPEYLEANRAFVHGLPLERCDSALDLACGTGILAAEILAIRPRARIVGVDISRESLLLARGRLDAVARAAGGAPATLIEASADRLPLPDESLDLAVMGNAIHNLPDTLALMAEVRRVLRPGGRFAFSTSFYAGTFAPDTERFYLLWMKEALSHIKAVDADARARGSGGVPRARGTVPHASSRPWLKPAEYRDLLERSRFTVGTIRERPVLMTRTSFEAVGSYAGLASVLLSGYPVDLACEALSRTAAAALRAADLAVVPRLWLEVTARRT